MLLLCAPAPAQQQSPDLEACRKLYRTGEYEQCLTELGPVSTYHPEAWWWLRIESSLATGRYQAALNDLDLALNRYNSSLRLRVLGDEVCRAAGDPERARALLTEIGHLVNRTPWRYNDPANLVTIGQATLRMGADARQVLEVFFDRARKEDPNLREVYLATGELGLLKHDDEVAAAAFDNGLKRFADDADLYYGLAVASRGSNDQRATDALRLALTHNPHHVPALLMAVDSHIDKERYTEAQITLLKVFEVNPSHPQAWAYKAVLAHLQSDPDSEQAYLSYALCEAPRNPEPYWLIGKKLAQKYRFAEAAAYQRLALEQDSAYLPAKIELCQDLLRLGQEDEGWALAAEVHETDGYDVVAFNLVTLKDSIGKYKTLSSPHFILRMDSREADLYGPRALELLERAKDKLCSKYQLDLQPPIIVEIFREQKDFAVRTFGMPGGAGFLGVCFGRVITANSPASQGGSPSNWEAVLWHEFCHVVTLEITRNRMPRWLSEGISVYEERQEDPSWGQAMKPLYREWILKGELTPVSQLSGAFLQPKSGAHLQFAYYESSLVVEFLVGKIGVEGLTRLLRELGGGANINDALERYVSEMSVLEAEFEEFALARAKALAPGLDWEEPEEVRTLARNEQALTDWLNEHPNSYVGLSLLAQRQISAGKWEAGSKTIERLLELYPEDTSEENAYLLLARVHRHQEQPAQERQVLEKLAALDNDAVTVFLRLLELASEAEDWPAVERNAQRLLAVNPLLATGHAQLARASEALGHAATATRAYRTLLATDPEDPAGVHYRLARLLDAADDPEARRHVLQALELAPRFRDAQQLLLQIVNKHGLTRRRAQDPSPAVTPVENPDPSPVPTPNSDPTPRENPAAPEVGPPRSKSR